MHLWQIIKHKYYVFKYCCQFRIPIQGLLHDLSKFSFIEFYYSCLYYKKGSSPIPRMQDDFLYKPWLHHKSHNKHHPEYWQTTKHGKLYCCKMDFNYVLEMIADWMGATKAYNRKFDIKEEYMWFCHDKNVRLHHETRELVKNILYRLIDTPINKIPLKELKRNYE